MNDVFLRRLVLVLCVVAVLAALGGVFFLFQIAARVAIPPLTLMNELTELSLPLVTALMGVLIAARRNQYAVGGVLVGRIRSV